MKDIDWSKAPEGTEAHHAQGEGYTDHWIKEGHFCVVGFEADGWVTDHCPSRHAALITKRPMTWTGEGLPPVGTTCEWKEKTGFSWVKATVLFITDSSVVMQRGDGFEWQMMTARTVFRPIRTPEQIAEEEREAGIAEIFRDLIELPWHNERMAEGLYDAGYRKV